MNRNGWNRYTTLFVGALCLATVLGPVAGARAQGTAAPAGAARPGMAATGTEQRIALDLRDVPFRTAIDALFGPTGLQFAIDPSTPNIPITVSLRDVEFGTALRVILRQAQATYRKEGPVYMLGPRQTQAEQTAATAEAAAPEAPANETAADQTWEKIPVQFQNAQIVGYAFGATALPTEDQLVRGGSGGGMGGYGGGLGGGGMMGGMGGMMGGMGGGMMGGMGMGGLGGGMMGGMGGGMMGGMGMGGLGGGFGGLGGGLGGGMGGFGGGIGGGIGGLGGYGGGGFVGRTPGRF